METNQQSKSKSILISFLITIALSLPGIIALILIMLPSIGLGNKIVVGKDGSNQVMVTTALDGAPRVMFYDANRNTPLTLQLTPTGVPMINIDSPNGTRAINISTALPGGKPQIMLFNPETGKPAWSVKIDDEGKPVITDHTLSDD